MREVDLAAKWFCRLLDRERDPIDLWFDELMLLCELLEWDLTLAIVSGLSRRSSSKINLFPNFSCSFSCISCSL